LSRSPFRGNCVETFKFHIAFILGLGTGEQSPFLPLRVSTSVPVKLREDELKAEAGCPDGASAPAANKHGHPLIDVLLHC
jgi:hypothetical protein